MGLTSHFNGKNDIGFYQEGIITGLGRLSFSEGSFYDGDLKEGQLEGEGIDFRKPFQRYKFFFTGFFYKKDSNKWVFGKFQDGKCTSVEKKGSGIPVEEISNQPTTFSFLKPLRKMESKQQRSPYANI